MTAPYPDWNVTLRAEGPGSPFPGASPPDAARHVDGVIQSRRSIRRYLPDPVPRDVLGQLLGAAMRAPSPHNRQPWRFAVLQEATSKARLARVMGERLRADRMRDGDRLDDIEADVTRSRG